MINLVLSETKRSLVYLREVVKNKFKINRIILYSKNYGDVYQFIKSKNLNDLLIPCKTDNINSSIVNKKLKMNKSKINIISTYSGEIVKNSNLLKNKLIHFHPGDLPKFKGSTTIYYSIILKKKICVTAFVMGKEIDKGKIIYKKYFKKPKNLQNIEKDFDNQIRVITLVDYLKKKKYKVAKVKDKYHPYFIAHPIIRQIALNKS
jgi:methionyl-tRNA formyltransferase